MTVFICIYLYISCVGTFAFAAWTDGVLLEWRNEKGITGAIFAVALAPIVGPFVLAGQAPGIIKALREAPDQ